MYKVLIATQVVGWSTIALLINGCSPSSPPLTTENLNARMDATAASTAIDRSNPTSQATPATTIAPNPVGDLELKQVNNVAALPQLSLQASKQATENQSTPTSSLADACPAFPCLILSQDPNVPLNKFNNPIYKLTAYRTKTSNHVFQLDAVTGRAFTQNRNRYQSNTEAPLPDGSYVVVARVVAGTIPEVGGSMVPIFPKRGFAPQMRRTDLGIHWDPSFNKDKKEDGTSGCIGLTKKNDYYRVRDFILKYRPRYLEVKITQ